jgi:hypothetical protein
MTHNELDFRRVLLNHVKLLQIEIDRLNSDPSGVLVVVSLPYRGLRNRNFLKCRRVRIGVISVTRPCR